MREANHASDNERTIAVFALGDEAYGVATTIVREIARVQDVAPVPNTPSYIDGVTNLRGRIIPVVDLRERFDMPRAPHTSATRIAIVELANSTVGLVVDAVLEVRTMNEDEVDDASSIQGDVDGNFIRGMIKLPDQLIMMLDLEQAFAEDVEQAA